MGSTPFISTFFSVLNTPLYLRKPKSVCIKILPSWGISPTRSVYFYPAVLRCAPAPPPAPAAAQHTSRITLPKFYLMNSCTLHVLSSMKLSPRNSHTRLLAHAMVRARAARCSLHLTAETRKRRTNDTIHYSSTCMSSGSRPTR